MTVPLLRHVSTDFHSYPTPFLYIGTGRSDIQGRPSQWCNPYLFLDFDHDNACALFKRYLNSRADLVAYLTPLGGSVMICDCDRGAYCHGHVLIETFTSEIVSMNAEEVEQDKLDAMSVACVMEGVCGLLL